MSEIEKCPICGNPPTIYPTYDTSDYCPEATECCGAAFTTVKGWNQYAVAVALARAIHAEEEQERKMAVGGLEDFESEDTNLGELGLKIDEAYNNVLRTFFEEK